MLEKKNNNRIISCSLKGNNRNTSGSWRQ